MLFDSFLIFIFYKNYQKNLQIQYKLLMGKEVQLSLQQLLRPLIFYMDSPQTLKYQEQLIFHHQIATNHNNTKAFCLYHRKNKSLQLHTTHIIQQNQLLYYLSFFNQRTEMFKKIERVKGDKGTNSAFGDQVGWRQREQYQKYRQNQILLELRQPFMEGIDLSAYIRRQNIEKKSIGSNLSSILFSLLNLFLRIDEYTLFIPSFRNVIINPNTLQIHLNLFSFAGIQLFNQKETIQSSRIKEVLPFFKSDQFQNENKKIDLKRGLAVLTLGLLLGKEIDLLPNAIFQDPMSKSSLAGLISKNKDTFTKLLSIRRVKKIFQQVEKQNHLKLTDFIIKMLVDEGEMTWSQIKRDIFQESTQDYTFEVGKRQNRHTVSIGQYLKQTALIKWNSLSLNQKQEINSNGLVTVSQNKIEWSQIDAEMLLIYTMDIDLQLLRPYRCLASFLEGCQDRKESKFQSDTLTLRDKFMKELLTFATIKPVKQSYFKAHQQIQSDSQSSNVYNGDNSHLQIREIDEDSLLSSHSYEQIEQLPDQKMVPLRRTSQSEESSNNAQALGELQIEEYSGNMIGMYQKQSSVKFAINVPANNQIISLSSQQPKIDNQNQSKKQRKRTLFNNYRQSKFQLNQQQKCLAILELWQDPLVHKFTHNGNQTTGMVSTSRLNTLREYSKILFISEEDS